LSEGAVAGQPTLSSDGLRMYVPVVEWKEVAWSNAMLHNATGREVLLLPQPFLVAAHVVKPSLRRGADVSLVKAGELM
jgi:hypothetical protein